MRLSATDKQVLVNAIQKGNQSIGWKYGTVFACGLEKKRQLNSLIKLKEAGLVEGQSSYQHQNGYQDPFFGRLWCSGKSWCEFSGKLTTLGIELAETLIDKRS